jgi:hypothetical protein
MAFVTASHPRDRDTPLFGRLERKITPDPDVLQRRCRQCRCTVVADKFPIWWCRLQLNCVFVILRARAKAVFIGYGLDLAFVIGPAPSNPGKANRLGLFISGRGAPGMIESAKRLDQ